MSQPNAAPHTPGRAWRWLLVVCALAGLLAWPGAQAQTRRVALVVGNASYPQKPLANPVNDATDLAAALRRLGFEVLERQNRSADELRRDLADFQDKLSPGAVGLFYFAGHGVQASRGLNYLLPVGVEYRRERDAELYGLEAGSVLRRMEESGAALNLVILDACRDSPLPSEGRSTASRGLGRMDAPSGSLIAFATAPGSTADENLRGRNGLYTQHLLRAIEQPGLRLEDVFKRVRRAVETDSNRRQSPEEISKLTSEEPFYFRAPAIAAAQAPAVVDRPSAVVAVAPPRMPAEPGRGSADDGSGYPAAPDMTFPQRSITLVVPFAAGGPTDKLARDFADALRGALGGSSTVVVENVGGAGGSLGANKVARAPADGYTLLLNHIGMATTTGLYRNLPFRPLDDFEYLGIVSDIPLTLVGRASLPANNTSDLVRWLQSQGGRATMANAGLGSASHLCGLLLADSVRANPTAVPYKGTAPAMMDLLGGQVDVMCDLVTNTDGQLAAGKLKGFALMSNQRPEASASRRLPVLADAGLRGDMTVWHGLYAPRGTPPAVLARLNAALRSALQNTDFRRNQDALGAVVAVDYRNTPAGHKRFVEAEINRWGPLIRAAGQYAD